MEIFWVFLPYFTIKESSIFNASRDFGHYVFLIHRIMRKFIKKNVYTIQCINIYKIALLDAFIYI